MTKHIIERFKSVGEFVGEIKGRKANKVFEKRVKGGSTLVSVKTDRSSYEFTKTRSYEASIKILTNGYAEGLKKMQDVGFKFRDNTGVDVRRQPINDVVGYAPHVPNAIAGVPKSMIRAQPTEYKAKVISINYFGSCFASVSTDRIISAGAKMLSIITALEKDGYRVALWICNSFIERNDEEAYLLVNAKEHRHAPNPLKISYPLVHPSYFRRQTFKWLETQPELTCEDFIYWYGSPYYLVYEDINDRVARATELGLLTSGQYYADFEIAEKANSIDELIKMIGIK